jgi:hypothetical protein
MNRLLICIEAHEIQTGLHPRHSFVVSKLDLWSHIRHSGRVVLDSDGFVLAQWD